MTYFETKPSSENPMSKSNSKFDVFMLIGKIIILLTFNLIGYESNHWILIFVLFFISGFMFFLLYENAPFYNITIKQVYLFIFLKIFYFIFLDIPYPNRNIILEFNCFAHSEIPTIFRI